MGLGDYDADAIAYFSAAGITGSTEKIAVNTLFLGLKANSLWAEMIALYLISPTSLAAAAINAKTPGTHDITWVNTPTHTTIGVDFNGTTQYGRTDVIPTDDLVENDFHQSFYSGDASQGACDIGARPDATHVMQWFIRSGADTFIYDSYNSTLGQGRLTGADTDGDSFYLASRRTSTDAETYRNGVSLGAIATGGGNQPAIELYIGARNNDPGAVSQFSTRQTRFSSIGNGLTDAQAATFNTLVQAYQTNVITGGRNV